MYIPLTKTGSKDSTNATCFLLLEHNTLSIVNLSIITILRKSIRALRTNRTYMYTLKDEVIYYFFFCLHEWLFFSAFKNAPFMNPCFSSHN